MKTSLIIDNIWDYRLPLYQKLSQLLGSMEFLLIKQKPSESLINSNLNYQIIPSKPRLLLTLLRRHQDIMIWGDAGSKKMLSSIIDACICFLISRIRKIPFIIWFGGWEWREKDHWQGIIGVIKRKASFILFPILFKCADAIITYGNLHRRFYISLGISPEKIFIAPNSSLIDTHINCNVESIKRTIGINNNEKSILYVGRLTKRKNVDIIIKSLYELRKTVKNVKLIIIGEGECKNSLQNLCKILGLERDVIFLGAIKRENLPPYYMLCDVFVYPTSREPWGLAINEAMQFGKPVIATPRVAATHDLIRNGINGYIVPERDPKALAEAIERIITDEKLARKMGRYSKKIIRKFTYEAMAKGFKYAIEFALKRG